MVYTQYKITLVKVMQTPFEILINKKNRRKEKIHQSLSPKRQGVTFSVQNALRPKTMQSQSKPNLHNKQNKNTKSAIQQIKLDLCKALPQQKSVQWIRNKGKKSQQLRLSFTKTVSLKGQYKLLQEQNTQKKVLIIEGNHYNKDLIKLNKKKLEELINKIQSKSRVKFKNNIVEQPNLSKQKINRLRKRQKSSFKGKNQIPKVQGHKFKNFQEAQSRKNSPNTQNKYLHLFESVGLENQLKVTNYLRCSSLLKEGAERNNQDEKFSLVLDSSKVLAFLRNVKKIKRTNHETPQLANRLKNPLEQRIGKGDFHSSQKNSKQSLSQRKNHYQIDVLKNSHFSVETSRIKTKINGINFENLEGWESTDDNYDFALANFSLLQ